MNLLKLSLDEAAEAWRDLDVTSCQINAHLRSGGEASASRSIREREPVVEPGREPAK
jgi:hypothetical protein